MILCACYMHMMKLLLVLQRNKNDTMKGRKKKFEEAYLNFKQEMYSSCLTVLTTVLEGVIVVI